MKITAPDRVHAIINRHAALAGFTAQTLVNYRHPSNGLDRSTLNHRNNALVECRSLQNHKGKTAYSYPRLGAIFGMDQSSVRHAIVTTVPLPAEEAA